MWSEFVSPETIDSRIWPRTAAIAERLWSPAWVRDVEDMYRRLNTVSFHLEELGLTHEKNYLMMLRRLANNQDISALKILVDVLEPVKVYQRNSLRPHTSYSPLTRVVDAARPDAKTAREFRNRVQRFLATPEFRQSDTQFLKKWLLLWRENHSDLEEIIAHSPILKEIEPLSAYLTRCAIIGLEALERFIQNQPTDEEWISLRLQMLEEAKQPHGQTELMIVSAIEKLVKATSPQQREGKK